MKQQPLINPFQIAVDPMARLLLVNFEQDPDSTYIGFEPQVFDDPVNGTGHLVIGWRQDGYVDVYHQPSLHLDAAKYDIAGKGLAHMVERELAGAHFEVDDFGVQAYYRFLDIHNRKVEINIREQNWKARQPFGLLAPMGAAAESPSAMPLVLLHDFYFVRQRHTDFEISVDRKRHQPDKLPIPMDFTRMYFTRYSPRPLIATLNPAFDGKMQSLAVTVGEQEIKTANTVLALEWTADKPLLKRITNENDLHPIDLSFDPPFPDILSMAAVARHEGHFKIEGDPATGSIAGRYTIEKMHGEIVITMVPTQGWQPRPTKLSLRFLYTVVAIFRNWPTTYEWTAQIHQGKPGSYAMRSTWRRINR